MMRLSAYILRTRALGDEKVPSHMVDGIGDMIAGGAELSALLKKRSANLSARHILGLWRATARHQQHMDAIDALMAARREDKQKPLTPALLKQTISAHEIEVLDRTEQLVAAGSVAEHRRRDAIKEALALWNACLALTRREGIVVVEGAAVEALDIPAEATLQSLEPETWVAVRQGTEAGKLSVRIELPMARFIEQVSKRGAELSAVGAGMGPEKLLEALVLGDVERWAFALKDEEVRMLGAREAGTRYLEGLTAQPVRGVVLAGVWVDGNTVGVAILNAANEVLAQRQAELDEGVGVTIEGLLGDHPVEVLVIPAKDEDEAPIWDTVRQHFEGSEALRLVETDDIGAAVQAGSEAPAEVALVLARRASAPLETWAAADPMALGLAPYPEFLDPDALRATLDEMRALAQAGVRPDELTKQAARRTAPRAAQKPLNPMLKSVDDLRPGMEVNGLVTNITQFGAFVNIGLSHEGLIHVSELADHFVNDPKEVVQIGQAIQARVLGVDRGRRRISLSLRADRDAARPDQVRPGGGVKLDDIPGGRGGKNRRSGFGGDRPRQPASGTNRSQALAELEALFKKK